MFNLREEKAYIGVLLAMVGTAMLIMGVYLAMETDGARLDAEAKLSLHHAQEAVRIYNEGLIKAKEKVKK